MLVPLMVLVPPLSQALKTPTPGPATVAIVLENGATVSPPAPSAKAATEVMPNAAAGGATLISYAGLPVRSLSLPAAATTIVVCATEARALRRLASCSKSRTLAR